LVYVMHHELLWFLSIYVFFLFLCYVSLFFVYDAFIISDFFNFFRFFFPLILWGFGMFNSAQRCVTIFLDHETLLMCSNSICPPRKKMFGWFGLVLWRLLLFTYFTCFGVRSALRPAMVSFHLCFSLLVFRFPFLCV
jgi:hypothetical protein